MSIRETLLNNGLNPDDFEHWQPNEELIMRDMSNKTGGPAYGHGAENGHCCGMTIRDYFAGQALAGMLSAPNGMTISHQVSALGAYMYADAMIAEREKGGGV